MTWRKTKTFFTRNWLTIIVGVLLFVLVYLLVHTARRIVQGAQEFSKDAQLPERAEQGKEFLTLYGKTLGEVLNVAWTVLAYPLYPILKALNKQQ